MLDSRRVVAGAIVAAAVLAVILLAVRSPAGREAASPATTTTFPATTSDDAGSVDRDARASEVSPATAPTVPALGDGGTDGAAVAPPPDLDIAKTVATDFAVGFSSFRYDEPESAPLDRVRHLMTDDVAAFLGTNSGSSAERVRQQDRREVTEATLDAVVTGGFDADHAIFTVVVAQETTSTEGATESLLAYQVALARAGGGWRITGVTIG